MRVPTRLLTDTYIDSRYFGEWKSNVCRGPLGTMAFGGIEHGLRRLHRETQKCEINPE